MGGYDIFRSELKNDGTWSVPENLGHPINTPLDDRFFVLAGSGKHGYYSSVKENSKGNLDIYMVTFLGPEKQVFLSNEDNLIASLAQPIKEKPVIATQPLTPPAVILQPLRSHKKFFNRVRSTAMAKSMLLLSVCLILSVLCGCNKACARCTAS